MTTTLKLKTPDEIQATITITATIGDLRSLQALLSESQTYRWPLSTLWSQIDQAIRTSQFVNEVSEEKEDA
jgi:hypothetical protein